MAANRETPYKRGDHGNFKSIESTRQPWKEAATTPFQIIQTPNPQWSLGSGPNSTHHSKGHKHISIDPWAPGRHPMSNYKLCISAVVPRPIALVSTRSKDGTATNLAPFSFFNMVHADPPLFVLGLTTPLEKPNDTLRNLQETGECVINTVSEGFVEAVNAAGINSPYGVSEWDITGLNPIYDCKTVSCARVEEAVFSIECKVESIREFDSKVFLGKKSGALVVLEATNFWARDDALNKDENSLDIEVRRHDLSFIAIVKPANTTSRF
jgi:flavin reductase (DIM6/NTAB) family NADH-FMN oxidoreductase RutF